MRYADDIVVGFAHRADAERFLAAMRERLGAFDLTLPPTKTRLIEFGRHAAVNRRRRGLGKPESFDFLDFTHICAKTRAGKFSLYRKTRRDRHRARDRALVNLTRALAVEWAPHVRVNAAAPTFVRAALVGKLLSTPNMERDVVAATPMQRLAAPAEIAAGILYLVSDEAAMVTGHTLASDGGWTAR